MLKVRIICLISLRALRKMYFQNEGLSLFQSSILMKKQIFHLSVLIKFNKENL